MSLRDRHAMQEGHLLPSSGQLLKPRHIKRIVASALSAVEREALLICWTGQPGRGKSVATTLLRDAVKRACPTAQVPVRRLQLAGEGERQLHRGQLRGIYGIYQHVLRPLPVTQQRMLGELTMCEHIVEYCRQVGLRLLICDEAGTQSPDQLRGIAQIADIGRERRVPLSILFVGMDDIEKKLQRVPQVRSRVAHISIFPDWPAEDAADFVQRHCRAASQPLPSPTSPTVAQILTEGAHGDLRRLLYLCEDVDRLVPAGAYSAVAVARSLVSRSA